MIKFDELVNTVLKQHPKTYKLSWFEYRGLGKKENIELYLKDSDVYNNTLSFINKDGSGHEISMSMLLVKDKHLEAIHNFIQCLEE